jgi:hypothetical protein
MQLNVTLMGKDGGSREKVIFELTTRLLKAYIRLPSDNYISSSCYIVYFIAIPKLSTQKIVGS